ncbi:flagellar hook protein FlgE [Marinisporobacter balticus]|uniref:Flagellar hook protein FlgE n=1 Tax=Marinisporobacter balticus TaxID=2018667 RepID=A0A4R2L116_9FIRM|nr:flagellar hook protein FlgE [Marinisporobacter balticus]TCO79943.1 flagellar hook protein FlgE [Marinisporobacter balticus]
MMRALFTAVSGLGVHKSKMDVISNNIANVNTVGYKKSRMTFKETFNQTLQGASAPQGGRGGTNPQQIGLGVGIGAMDTIHTIGVAETTDVPTDLMINGDGFFMVSDDASFLNRSYTRAGNFQIDRAGNLNNADGLRVLGYRVEDMGENPTFKSNLEGLVISKAMTFPAKATTKVTLTGQLNSETEKTIDLGTVGVEPAQGNVSDDPTKDAVLLLKNGKYEVNPTYADAVAKEVSFQAFDNLGGMHNFKQVYIKIKDKQVAAGPPAINNSQYQVETFYVKKDGTMLHAGAATTPPTATGTSPILEFDSSGKLVNTPKLSLEVGAGLTNGAGALGFDVELNSDNIIMTSGESTMSDEQDGYKQGSLDTYTIGQDGIIQGTFTNGMKCSIGRLALAKFKNPAGLLKTSGNMFINTANSGSPIVGKPGESGFSTLAGGKLEMSNVDIAKEFTDMITTQRGFQASAKIITTSDEILQELVNLKR